MTMIEVVSPSLDEYMSQVRSFASRYLGDEDRWFELRAENFSGAGDDLDEFSFIRMALWDKLMEREFFPLSSPPGQVSLFGQCGTTEPGVIPGSFILDGDRWVLSSTLSLSTAY